MSNGISELHTWLSSCEKMHLLYQCVIVWLSNSGQRISTCIYFSIYGCNINGNYVLGIYTQCRASCSESIRLKVLLCAHDCCNRSMHGIVFGRLGWLHNSSNVAAEKYVIACDSAAQPPVDCNLCLLTERAII